MYRARNFKLSHHRKKPKVVRNYNWSYNIRFEWDESKNRYNIRKHGFDFVDAEEMFRGLLVVNLIRAGRLRRKAVDWGWLDSRTYRVCGLYGARPGDDSHHLAEKGKPS